jgi:hypothetical protein
MESKSILGNVVRDGIQLPVGLQIIGPHNTERCFF